MVEEDGRIAVTGGAGFIGSHTVGALCREGYDVIAVDNTFAGSESLVHEQAEFVQADVRDRAEIEDMLTDIEPDVIIHLAAIHYIPYCNENPEEAFDVNVMGTRHVLDAARTLPSLKRVVFASSAAVYPPREEANTEDSVLNPMDIYGKTKLIGEDLFRLFTLDTGIPTVAARLFNVYGRNETNMHLIPAVLNQVKDAEDEGQIELGNLTPCRDFVHVDDVANALRQFATEPTNGFEAYNVGSGMERSVRDVAETIIEASEKDLTIEQDSDRVRESDRPHLLADTSKIRERYDWGPTRNFEDSIADLLADPGQQP